MLKASLPSPKGCGLFRVSDYGSIAWWSSVSQCLRDPLLFQLRHGLSVFAPAAFNSMITALGGPLSKHWLSIMKLFPQSSEGLTNGSDYTPLANSKTKLSKAVLKAVGRYHPIFMPLPLPLNVVTTLHSLQNLQTLSLRC